MRMGRQYSVSQSLVRSHWVGSGGKGEGSLSHNLVRSHWGERGGRGGGQRGGRTAGHDAVLTLRHRRWLRLSWTGALASRPSRA